ncbi:MAG TPA: ABC transporter permease [Pyrinomonadaceae bacterium]|nr:ABC transporter permease [Pyrinomonadaceae bacterium]
MSEEFGGAAMDGLLKDLRYAFRSLVKRPGFSLIAILTLALGIGANTAIFTLLNAVVFKSLPVPAPQELVFFDDTPSEGTSLGDPPTGQWQRFSYANYQYFRDHDQSFQGLSAFRSGEAALGVSSGDSQAGNAAQRARGHLVSGNYFSVLGVNAMLGRVLSTDDDKPGASPAAVMSHAYWSQQWRSDPSIVNKQIVVNGTSFTVVGVMPPKFYGVRVRRSPDLWLPLAFQPQIELRPSAFEDHRVYWLNFVGRLKPGVTLEQAQASTNVALKQFLTNEAGSNLNDDIQSSIANSYVQLAEGSRGISGLRRVYAQALKMLMVIVVLVLLIAGANVGNLLLSRAAARKAEISLRLALGASRYRIVRQLLCESLALAAIGGLCGILLAQWGVSILVALVAQTSPLDVRPDTPVLVFTAAVSLSVGVLFGLAPALRASKTDLTTALKEKSARTGRRQLQFSLASALVVSQVALSMVLLTGAGLFARSLIKLQEEEVGFNRDNVLLAGIDPRLARYKSTELSALYSRLLDRLEAIPGVQSATVATYSPMSGTGRSGTITVRGYTPDPGQDMEVANILIGPSYLETLGVPLLLGRDFGPRDTPAAQKIALVNQSFAQRFFPGQNPIGKQFYFGDEDDPERGEDLEIVGVIGDVKYDSAREEAGPTAYRPILQVQDSSAYSSNLQIRSTGDAASLAPEVRQAIAEVDDKLPISGVTTLREQLKDSLDQEKLLAQLVSFFGLLALLLACIGLYGVMAHGVVRRTKEIGIRMALGAERRSIIWMVLRETLVLILIGLAIGIPIALGAGRLIASQLFGLSAADPLTLLGATLVLIGVAILAGLMPARKASRVDPLTALRYE